jgi:hypothetical protein
MTVESSLAARSPLVWLGASALVFGLAGCGEESSFNKGFESKFAEEFTKSCSSSAVSSGAPADKAAAICKCTADELIEKYDASDLVNVGPDKATPIMTECARKNGLAL